MKAPTMQATLDQDDYAAVETDIGALFEAARRAAVHSANAVEKIPQTASEKLCSVSTKGGV